MNDTGAAMRPAPARAVPAAKRGPPWGAVLLLVYSLIALAPIAIAAWQDLRPRPFLDDLNSGLALAAFAMLLMEFVLSGRFRAVSGPIGIDVTMRFHQLIARALTVVILLHPFWYTLPWSGRRPWDTDSAVVLNLTAWGAVSGFIAWGTLLAVFGLALFRDGAGIRYEAWRISHGLGAAAIAFAGFHHVLVVGRYSDAPALAGFWIAAGAVALGSLAVVYFVRPLLQRANPFRVAAVTPGAERTWTLTLEPAPGARPLAYRAGQFAWLKFRGPFFTVTEHPFSISSSPAAAPKLEFMIKEAGDFTGRIGELEPGRPAYVDGPHGNFTLHGRSGAGLVFIAGGVGLAPIMGILRDLRAARDARPMVLVYGNRHAGQVAYAVELGEISRELDLKVIEVLSEPGPGFKGVAGQLDSATLARCLPDAPPRDWLYFVCGPTGMADSVEDFLAAAGVPLAQIVSERFRYESGRVTRRERVLLGACGVVVLAVIVAACTFALR